MKLKLLLFKRKTFLWQYCILATKLSYDKKKLIKLEGSVNSASPFRNNQQLKKLILRQAGSNQ